MVFISGQGDEGNEAPCPLNLQLQSVRFVLPQNGLITGTFEEIWSSGTTSASGTARYFANCAV